MTRWIGWALLAAAGCAGDEVDDSDRGTEADTDVGTEADSDVDTDVDTTPGTNTLTGTLTYRVTHEGYDADGNAIPDDCQTTFSIRGEEVVGQCEGCSWAFTLEQGEGVGDCEDPDPALLFGSTDPQVLAHVATIDDVPLDYLVLATPGDLEDTNTWTNVFVRSPHRGFEWSGTDLTVRQDIGLAAEVTDPRFEYSNDCDSPDVTRGDAPIVGTSVTASIPCGTRRHDSYTFEVSGDETLAFSVDTIDPATGFRPNIILNAPDGCASSLFAYAFDCSSGPSDARCPAGTLANPQPGTWEMLIVDEGLCEGETGDYELTVSGTTLTPVDDDERTSGSYDRLVRRSVLDATFRFEPR